MTTDELDQRRARAIESECPFTDEVLSPDEIRDIARAIREADEAAGLAIVPKEPTGDMAVAGGEAQSQSIGSWGEPKVVYRAMLATSPYAGGGE